MFWYALTLAFESATRQDGRRPPAALAAWLAGEPARPRSRREDHFSWLRWLLLTLAVIWFFAAVS